MNPIGARIPAATTHLRSPIAPVRGTAPAVAPAAFAVDIFSPQGHDASHGYPAMPSHPAPPRLGHGLGLIVTGLGEVAGAALRGAWVLTRLGVDLLGAIAGFAASFAAAVLGGIWAVASTVLRALGRAGRAMFDPSYDQRPAPPDWAPSPNLHPYFNDPE